MQLLKEEHARKRICNGRSVQIENSVGSLEMPNSYPCDGIFNPHLTTIKDSYILYGKTTLINAFFLSITVQSNQCSNFSMITAFFFTVRIFRIFTVCGVKLEFQEKIWSDQ